MAGRRRGARRALGAAALGAAAALAALGAAAATAADGACVDRNERCAEWAAAGECEENAIYMVGSATGGVAGFCEKSCGACDVAAATGGGSNGLAASNVPAEGATDLPAEGEDADEEAEDEGEEEEEEDDDEGEEEDDYADDYDDEEEEDEDEEIEDDEGEDDEEDDEGEDEEDDEEEDEDEEGEEGEDDEKALPSFSACVDTSDDCATFKQLGQCQNTRDYLMGNPEKGFPGVCRKTCGACVATE